MDSSVMVVRLPAAHTPTCRGSSRHSMRPPLRTLNWGCAVLIWIHYMGPLHSESLKCFFTKVTFLLHTQYSISCRIIFIDIQFPLVSLPSQPQHPWTSRLHSSWDLYVFLTHNWLFSIWYCSRFIRHHHRIIYSGLWTLMWSQTSWSFKGWSL